MANLIKDPHSPIDLNDPSSQTPILPGDGGLSVRLDETASDLGDDGAQVTTVAARGYWGGVWNRVKKDKLALVGGGFIILLFFVAFAGAPIAAKLLGHGPNEPFLVSGGLDADQLPVGPMTKVGKLTEEGTIEEQWFILGADSTLARDEFLRILYGAQVSLEVGVGATFLVVVLGVLFGAIAGFYGGWSDTLISRAIEITMAFPYLLFVIALAGYGGYEPEQGDLRLPRQGSRHTRRSSSVLLGWFYYGPCLPKCGARRSARRSSSRRPGWSARATPGSFARTSCRTSSVRSSSSRRSASPPSSWPRLACRSSGSASQLPTASWGRLLAQDAPQYYTEQPLLMVWPGLALIFTTLAVQPPR